MEKIFARNLTALAALAAQKVNGNPVTTRLESGVGNCFPGLEFDHRNLDRRFFPGLVFEFVSGDTSTERVGAHLVEIDTNDPDLSSGTFAANPADRPDATLQADLADALAGSAGTALAKGKWFLASITQKRKTIDVQAMDGLTVWRLIRSLEPGPVAISLKRHSGSGATPRPVKLKGWRRVFTGSATGTLSSAYAPGELTQSLCSPWMHDFRDCACYYWASNHPDVVLGEDLPGEPILPDAESGDPVRANTPIDWLRSDRSRDRTVPARPTDDENRPAQMDHYEINQRWQDLSIVLLGKETSNVFQPRPVEMGTPFKDPDELAKNLFELAKLEHAVALEYLYARYSVKNPDNRDPLVDELNFVRHELLRIAVSEMRHLRWVNQLLWELDHRGLTSRRFGPSLGIADKIPVQAGKERAPLLLPLRKEVLNDFIAVEAPTGTLDGQYARVVSTLRDQTKYPDELAQLAERIIADGMEHYSRFREIQATLQPFFDLNPSPYMIDLQPAPMTNPAAKKAFDNYQEILKDLAKAYATGDAEDFHNIAPARALMFQLDDKANQLATRGLGVPFFKSTLVGG